MQRFFFRAISLPYALLLLAAVLLLLNLSIHPALAEEKTEPLLPPPPYVTAEGLCISVGVTWDAAALAQFLPSAFSLTPDATGAINICSADRGYVVAPIAYADFDVDLASPLSADGGSFLWQALSVSGAKPAVVNTLREYYGEQTQLGTVQITETPTGYRATGSLKGKEVVAVEVKLANKACEPVGTVISFLHVQQRTSEIQRIDFPVAPDICEAEPVSVKVTPLPGDKLLAALQPKEITYAVVGKNATISWGRPTTIGWSAPPEK
jgi:hypothetical protein